MNAPKQRDDSWIEFYEQCLNRGELDVVDVLKTMCAVRVTSDHPDWNAWQDLRREMDAFGKRLAESVADARDPEMVRLRVSTEDEGVFECSAADFLRDNDDGEADAAALVGMAVGDEIALGGGAAPHVLLTRIKAP